jgi:uncharacterized protein YjbJ (UPF0337 family)
MRILPAAMGQRRERRIDGRATGHPPISAVGLVLGSGNHHYVGDNSVLACQKTTPATIPVAQEMLMMRANRITRKTFWRSNMNEDTLKGQWTQLKGQVREQWGKLTNDDLDRVQGEAEQLVGRIQERYGIARDEAQRQVDSWAPATRQP